MQKLEALLGFYQVRKIWSLYQVFGAVQEYISGKSSLGPIIPALIRTARLCAANPMLIN
jgi:hypothetical protein